MEKTILIVVGMTVWRIGHMNIMEEFYATSDYKKIVEFTGGIVMGILRKMVETVGENVSESKEARMREKEYVQNNKGTKAICAFIANLFAKGNTAYCWVKENHVGLYPIVKQNSVSLCYMQAG